MLTIQNELQDLDIHLSLLVANGTAAQNRVYCTKDGDFWESGDISKTGKGARSDLNKVCSAILKKRPISEIGREDPEVYVKFHRGMEKLELLLEEPPKTRTLEVHLYFGDAGTGKTHRARLEALAYGDYYEVMQPDGNLWWCDYNKEKSIIINEFKGWISPTKLNSILDPNVKCKLNCKGTHKFAYYEHVWITSNYPPEEWWSDKVIWHKASLYRRIHHIVQFNGTDWQNCEIKILK